MTTLISHPLTADLVSIIATVPVPLSGSIEQAGPELDFHQLPGTSQVRFHFRSKVRHSIFEHATLYSQREVGGLLIGQVFGDGQHFLVDVDMALPAHFTLGGPIHVTFTAASWLDLATRRSALHRGKTVGWYHSHPGLGIFLSRQDIFLQRSFFADEPWYLAMVIDPLDTREGVFLREGGELIRFGLDCD